MRIAFLGDVYTADLDAYPPVDRRIAKLLRECDHVVANLEGPVTACNNPISKTGPVMRQSIVALELLHHLGVDVIGLANNHVLDHGQRGLKDTLELVSAHGFGFGGAGLSIQQAYSPIRLWSNEARVSVLCAGENGFGCLAPPNRELGYAWLFHPTLESILIQEAREADHVIVFCHGGVERIDRPLPEFRRAYHRLVDLGASAVIGHHPHVTQGIETYQGAPICYSLGNFCFVKEQAGETWYSSQIPILAVNRDSVELSELHHAKLDLARGLLYDEALAPDERTEGLSAEFETGEYHRRINEDIRELWFTRYINQYEDAVNAFTPPLSGRRLVRRIVSLALGRTQPFQPLRVQALLEIESHRWAVARAMRIIVGEEGS